MKNYKFLKSENWEQLKREDTPAMKSFSGKVGDVQMKLKCIISHPILVGEVVEGNFLLTATLKTKKKEISTNFDDIDQDFLKSLFVDLEEEFANTREKHNQKLENLRKENHSEIENMLL